MFFVLLIAGLTVGVALSFLIPGLRDITETDRKKIEAMGRAGIDHADRLSKDKKPSDRISRPIKENGYEQHRMVKRNGDLP